MLASILEIPNANGSDTKAASDPYATDRDEALRATCHRERGTVEVVVIFRVPRLDSPAFVVHDGKVYLKELDKYGTDFLFDT